CLSHYFFFSSRRRHTRSKRDWSSDVCSSDLISVPTIPALARARRCLDQLGASGRVTLIITGGLRTHVDFIKALALGADGVALAKIGRAACRERGETGGGDGVIGLTRRG